MPVELEFAEEKLIKISEEIGNVLSKPHLRQYFDKDLVWLRSRQKTWRSSRMRIALMGVTSTGKSTLLNAILGKEVLPRGVRPTSNTLAICRHGAKLSAQVYFNNGKKKKYKASTLRKRLEALANETKNPGNEKGVREIEIISPDFVFGSGVELVDTPGLDAYGLERHEEITLQTLLPGVDAVIYVTDAKASSDVRIAMYLSSVNSNGKRIVLVQNKIDAVTPELGPGGQIRLDREGVAASRLNRLETLVQKTLGSGDSAPIVQLSALRALEGNRTNSGLKTLVDVVESFLNEIEPVIQRDRCEQLLDWVTGLIEVERSSDLEKQKKLLNKELKRLNCIENELEALLEKIRAMVEEADTKLHEKASSFKTEIRLLTKRDKPEASGIAIVRRFESWQRKDPLSRILKELQEKCKAISKKLGLPLRDSKVRMPHLPAPRKIHVKTVEKSLEKEVNKSGIFNKFRRWIGWGGTKTIKETWTEIDVASLRKVTNEVVSCKLKWGKIASKIVRDEAADRYSILKKELEQKRETTQDKLEATAPLVLRNKAAQELEPIRASLCKTLETLPAQSKPNWEHSCLDLEDDNSSKLVPSYAVDILMLANAIAERRFTYTRDVILSRIAVSSVEAAERILIAGFDPESLQEFLTRFWRLAKLKNIRPGALVKKKNTCGVRQLNVLLMPDSLTKPEKAKLLQVLKEPTTVFLLLDAEKPGATEGMLSRSTLPSLFNKKTKLIACIESMKALSNSGSESEVEAISAIFEIVSQLGVEIHGCMANDDRIHLTYTVDYLLHNKDNIITVRDEREAVEAIALGHNDSSVIEHVARLLKNWRASQCQT